MRRDQNGCVLCVLASELSRKEQLSRQKLLLNKTLGLDGGIGIAAVGEELFKEEDLIIEQSAVQRSVPQVFTNCLISPF